MNRTEIKATAKQKIKGNLWNILWPLLVIAVLESIIMSILGGNSNNAVVNVDFSDFKDIAGAMKTSFSPISTLISIVFSIVNIAYYKYIINFLKTGKFEFNDIINCIKEKWLNIFIVSLVTSFLIGLGYALLIIPGIILTLGFGMAPLIVVDSDLGPIDSIKKSWTMMKGYKWNYFVFLLSFIGWILLACLTFGLLFIWLVPYMTVAEVIYYENLKKITKE